MTSSVDTSLLMGKQKVGHIVGWDKTSSQLEAWAVFFTVLLVDDGAHPKTYEIFLLLEETSGVSPRIRV